MNMSKRAVVAAVPAAVAHLVADVATEWAGDDEEYFSAPNTGVGGLAAPTVISPPGIPLEEDDASESTPNDDNGGESHDSGENESRESDDDEDENDAGADNKNELDLSHEVSEDHGLVGLIRQLDEV